MANKKIKLRAKLKDGIISVRALLKHPMETGLRKDKVTGKIIPAHHITEVTCQRKDEVVFCTQWGPGVSKNPFLAFNLKDIEAEEKLTVSFIDNMGETAAEDIIVK